MKYLHINITKGELTWKDVPEHYAFLGGRGFTSSYLNREIPAQCDPLGPENVLIFAPGLLSGTTVINSSRISIGAKSPLTGGIKESNVGGTISAALARTRVHAIVVSGKAPEGKTYCIRITKGGKAELIDAEKYRGMGTYEAVEKIFESYGNKNCILCVGPAGEYGMASASIQSTDVDGRPCRAAGRGGMGAVMGTKGLKALIVERGAPSLNKSMPDPQRFKVEAKLFAQAVQANPLASKILPEYGTSGGVANMNKAGAFPCYNAKEGLYDDWEKIGPERFVKTIEERGGVKSHVGCSQCIIRCSNVWNDADGKYLTGSLEYETLWSMGGMMGIHDLDTIAKLDYTCDNLGLDTMNTGVAIGVAMDAGYKEFGDSEGAFEIMKEIEKGTDLGKIFGDGPSAVGKHFGHTRVPVAKNQAIAGYDPRAIQGMAVTYATSPMGADHTAGYVIKENLGPNSALDPLSPEGQVEVSRNAQIRQAFMDSMGFCSFATSSVKQNIRAEEAIVYMVNAKCGINWSHDDIQRVGIEILRAEREFNRKAGFTAKDDRLADMFYKEPLSPHNKTVLISDSEMDSVFDF